MSDDEIMDLYELLPALYRLRDTERGHPLRALLEIIGVQADLIKQNIDGLWDDFFIETCADWVIPYIGDLVGTNTLYEIVQGRRADVAKTIYYRRRKGTLPMLEELARDVTGWGAHAVAFFELLGWTQNLNHLRYQTAPNPERRDPNAVNRVGTVNLRNLDAPDRLDGPFDLISHTVDVRPIGRVEGWHNIRKIGFFLWRLRHYPMTDVPARQSTTHPHGYHFSPLGNPAPLFNNPQREADEAGLAREIHVPGPIRPVAFYFNPGDYYGPDESFAIYRGPTADPDQLVSLSEIVCKDLATWGEPPSGRVAVDVRLGRIAFAAGESPDEVTVAYNYGFSADIGGGPYDRRQTLADPSLATWAGTVAQRDPEADFSSLSEAVTSWADPTDGNKANAVITIIDNGTYAEEISIEPAGDHWLVIQADNGKRPTLRLVDPHENLVDLRIAGGGSTEAALTLNGLLIEGDIRVEEGSLGHLQITHCTLVPGRELGEEGQPREPDRPSVIVEGTNDRLRLEIDHSIVGPLRLPSTCEGLTIRDSIIAAPKVAGTSQPAIAMTGAGDQPGPPTTLERTTVFGAVHVKELTLASEVIITDPVVAGRRQAGCVRFSYVPEGSQTPRRYRCQPDLALEGVTCPGEQARIRARLRPSFTSVHYGHPAYAQLSLTCAEEIRTGAEDGSEMGAFSHLKQPQRETNLRIRLEEYLPFGLEAGLIYVT